MALAHIEKRAQRIRERRDELGMTQEVVADRMQEIHAELHPGDEPDRTRGQMVSDWERAINEPSPAKLELLAKALQWTVGDLNTDPPEEESTTPVLFGESREEDLFIVLDRLSSKLDRLSHSVALLVEHAGIDEAAPEQTATDLEEDEEGVLGRRDAANDVQSESPGRAVRGQ